MKRNNKKGFTIVELVIVIAVIAILAAVLIPTFSSVVENAKESAALQEARNIYTNYLAATVDDNTTKTDFYIKVDGYYFHVKNGEIDTENVSEEAPSGEAAYVITGVSEDGNVSTEAAD